MNVIVLGASGHIGKNFILKAPKSWNILAIYNNNDLSSFVNEHKLNNVIPIRCDLTNEKDVINLSNQVGNEFDVCLYLTANTIIPQSVENPIYDLYANTITLLNFLKVFKGDKIIFFSSGAVYDGLSGYVNSNTNVSPRIPYAISKLASENYIKFYVEKKKIYNNYVVLRFFGAYGPYENPRKVYSKLINAFYFENKKEFKVYGDGKNLIDAMYIDDTIDGILKIIECADQNLILDFSSGNPLTIDELVTVAAKTFGKENPSILHEGITEEYIKFYTSYKDMEKLFDFKPTITLEEGFRKFSNWMENRV